MQKLRLAALFTLLLPAATAAAQEETPPISPESVAAEAAVGSYDVTLTIQPSQCQSTQPFAGEWQSTMDVAQGRRGLLLRLEQTKSFFREPVAAEVKDGGFSYRGPVRVYLRPIYPSIYFELTGALEPDGSTLLVMINGNHEGCPITGELRGTRNASPLRVPTLPPPDRSSDSGSAPPTEATPPPADPTAVRTLGKRKLPGSSFSALMNSESSFQTFNFPDRFIRHMNWLGFVEPSHGNYGSIIFRMVPGLGGRCVSLESKDHPGHFLRHQDWRIRLSKLESDPNMRADATFCAGPGLASTTGISFEALSAPGHYIRHRNFELWLDRNDGSEQVRKDATFLATPPGGAAAGVR